MTRLGRALDELDVAMAGRPYIVLYDQAHRTQGRACVKGTFSGGFVAAMGLAHIAPEFVMRLCGTDVKCGGSEETRDDEEESPR